MGGKIGFSKSFPSLDRFIPRTSTGSKNHWKYLKIIWRSMELTGVFRLNDDDKAKQDWEVVITDCDIRLFFIKLKCQIYFLLGLSFVNACHAFSSQYNCKYEIIFRDATQNKTRTPLRELHPNFGHTDPPKMSCLSL